MTEQDAQVSEAELVDDAADAEDALQMLFEGHVDMMLPPEEIEEFHDFIRDEALMRRRFAVSFRLECRCLAWIGYSLANVVTHEDGIEFKANPMQTYVPECDVDTLHPEGPNEEPPDQFLDWPIWPLEIYQDELEDELVDELEVGE